MITYHDNNIYPQYGEDHRLLDNWDPDGNYGEKDYAKVYFRIEGKHRTWHHDYWAFDTETDERNFNNAKRTVFESLDWEVVKPDFNSCCMDVIKGKASLYLHPEGFSGIVLKRDIKQIAEALDKNEHMSIRWVDIYDTVYDMTDWEYDDYLGGKTKETWVLLFESCKTPRRNKYLYRHNIAEGIAKRIQLPRIGCRSVHTANKETVAFVNECIDKMVEEKYLFLTKDERGYEYIRTPNKGELKQMGKKAIT